MTDRQARTDEALNLRPATPADVPQILTFIRDLATYEREPDAVLATEADLAQAVRGMRACQHNLHREEPFQSVAGTQGGERRDRGGAAALAVFGLVEDARWQGISVLGVIFGPGEGGESGHWRGSGCS